MKRLIRKRLLAWIATCVLVFSAVPTSFAQSANDSALLPGAFGEAYDSLDEATLDLCKQYMDAALPALLQEVKDDIQLSGTDAYVEILHTTVYLIPETPSPDLTDIQQRIYEKYYQDLVSIVAFVVLDNYMQMEGPFYGEVTGVYEGYAIGKDGEASPLSLRKIRSQMYTNPVLPGMRIINFGSSFNQIHVVTP